jgi:hypothetical protein
MLGYDHDVLGGSLQLGARHLAPSAEYRDRTVLLRLKVVTPYGLVDS